MTLPIRTTLDDADSLCKFLVKKTTGITPAEARKVLDSKYLDGRKLSALKTWGLIDVQDDGKLKILERGRWVAKDEANRKKAFLAAVKEVPAYAAIVERAAHRDVRSITALDVA